MGSFQMSPIIKFKKDETTIRENRKSDDERYNNVRYFASLFLEPIVSLWV